MRGPSRLVEIEEVAGWLATSTRHVLRLVGEKRIPYVKVGRFVRFDPEDIAGWIEEHKVASVEPVTVGAPWPPRPVGTLDGQRLAPRTSGRQAPSNDQPPVWVRHRTR